MGCSQGRSIQAAPENPTARGWLSWGWSRLLNPPGPSCSPSLRLPRHKGWAEAIPGKLGQSWGWGWEGDGDLWSKLLPPAVTHSALIAPRSRGLLAAPHQRCHGIVMREELMVKGDTTNKTSSGKLSLLGRIKGHGERPSRCRCRGSERQVPGTGVVAALAGLCGHQITRPQQGQCRQGMR